MEEEIDPSVIKATQLSLGKYVKRPPLSEKLLKKPPFRFLHDIVTSVLKSKGFFDGLFEDNELISDNVKDRESKICFLNKVISVVSLTTGESLSVKPSKIVAGQEPTKTNQLLQCLARALDQNLSSDAAVKQFKAGVKIPIGSDKKSKETVNKNTDSKKLTSKSSEKLVTTDKNAQNVKSKRSKESVAHKKESPPKRAASKVLNKKPPEKSKQEITLQQTDQIQQKNKIPLKATENSEKKSVPEIEQTNVLSNEGDLSLSQYASLPVNNLQSDSQVSLKSHESISSNMDSNQENEVEVEVNLNVLSTSTDKSITNFKDPDGTELDTNNEINVKEDLLINTPNDEIQMNVVENKKTLQDKNIDLTEVNKKTSEGSRIITGDTYNKNDLNISTVLVRSSSVRPSSSRPGAPRIRDKSDNMISDAENIVVGKVNIISENALQEEEDEDTSIVVENQTTGDFQEVSQSQEQNNLVNNQSSHLVQQILDSQKEYSQVSGKTEIEWQFGVQKTSDVFNQEMEQLRFNVQALSRIANPLGKLLDHIQEDVEVMRQELQQWTKLYEETSKDLIKQKNANEESLLPFHVKIKQLTMDISEKREKITDLKVSIHKNASKIEKLLASGNVQ